MFRLVGYDIHENDKEDRKEYIKFISEAASEMLIKAFERTYSSDADMFAYMFKTYFGYDFFADFGKIYGMDDVAMGMLIIKKKTAHILEMLRNEEEYYTFDLLEEYMLYTVVEDSFYLYEGSFDKWSELIDREKTNEVEEVLKNKYKFNSKKASEFADQLTNIFLVRLKEDEDENMYFWDRDYEHVFDEGFIKGMQFIKSYAGKTMGYGYDYACEMFNNVGMEPPIQILGTKAASEVEDEVSEQRIRDIFDKMEEDMFGKKVESGGADDELNGLNVIPFKK